METVKTVIVPYLRILFSFVILLVAILDYKLCHTKDSSYNANCQYAARIVIITFTSIVLILEMGVIIRPLFDRGDKDINKIA